MARWRKDAKKEAISKDQAPERPTPVEHRVRSSERPRSSRSQSLTRTSRRQNLPTHYTEPLRLHLLSVPPAERKPSATTRAASTKKPTPTQKR